VRREGKAVLLAILDTGNSRAWCVVTLSQARINRYQCFSKTKCFGSNPGIGFFFSHTVNFHNPYNCVLTQVLCFIGYLCCNGKAGHASEAASISLIFAWFFVDRHSERVHVRMWLRPDMSNSLVPAGRNEPGDLMSGRTDWKCFGKCYRETF